MRRRTALRGTLLGLTALGPVSASLVACQNGPAAPTRDLLIGATAQPPNLDPVVGDAAAIPQALLYNVYETLVKVDDAGGLQPLLATSWEVSADRLTHTFHLAENATFAKDNRKLTAEDVVWSINRVKQSGTAVLKAQMAPVANAVATDDHTLTVTLSAPSNSWLHNMASTAGMVFDSRAGGDFASRPAGSGPYTLTSWTKGNDLVLGQRPDHWGPKPYFTSVTIRYYADPNAQNAAMLAGQLDILSNVQAPQALGQFNDPSRFTVLEGTTSGEVVMGFNNAAVLKDRRLRQAIRHAVDHKALLQTVWAGYGTLIGSMVPPTDPWYEDLTGLFPYDPGRARALVKEAGYAGQPLRMRLPTLPYATAAGQFVASQLREVGFTVATDELEFPARWLDLVFSKAEYDISIVAHVEPRDLVKFADPKYYWRYDSPTVRKLVAEADRGTEADQVAKLKQAAKVVSEDAACDFLFLLPNLVVTKPDIIGVRRNATTLSLDLTTIARKEG